MNRNFTLNDLFLYYYNELPQDEVQAFKLQLQFDSNLQDAYQSLQETARMLNSIKEKPSDASIRLILDYNRKNSSELEAIWLGYFYELTQFWFVQFLLGVI